MMWFILALGVILRVANLNQSLWLDEAAQVIESARPIGQQLQISGDFQPPLFHILLHFWMQFGRSEVYLRLLPVFFGVFTIYSTYLLVKHLVSRRIAMLSALLLAISPFHIWYSQEVRPYALAAFLGILTTYFLIKKNWFGYVIAAILSIYSMYLAVFMFLGHGLYLYLFARNDLKKWLGAQIIIGLAFMPWMPQFLIQLHIGSSLQTTLPGWSDAVSTPWLKAIPLVFAKFTIGRISISNKLFYLTLLIGYGCLFLWCLWASFVSRLRVTMKLLILLTIPILAAWVVSLYLPILAPQRVLFTLPFFVSIIAFSTAKYRWRNWVVLFLFVILGSVGAYLYSFPAYQREDWRSSVKFVEANRTAKSAALFAFPDSFAPWQWYSRGVVPSIALAPTFTVKKAELSQIAPQLIGFDRIFYFHYLTDLTDPKHQVEPYLNENGFYETSVHDFSGVGFISIYEKAVAVY